ncbi:MGDG synthase family glycosyltransferase [Streptacidiphilus jiangxiensis]|uniref:UDP-N-acetylglucosamine:LPS N-acetylglucosamine transferase n=1 Tax=Streptacidiphilus jiangxiensis TaxID=235985 RepID=A0A1H7QIL9_STRJI|nr:glycosyltransferase [Streptacidiphilus jiangxiensis]SEL47773.1 UDP-N-acetylglucosamine:LPS N-acetylglucosamine transferase [Streptacidiphilus jiangxiensis]
MQAVQTPVPPAVPSLPVQALRPRRARRGGDGCELHPASADRPLRALVVTGSVGAGHNGAANELTRRLTALGLEVDCRDFLDALPRRYRRLLQDGYEFSAGKLPRFFEWLFQNEEHDSVVRSLTLHLCRLAARQLGSWTDEGWDVVVTTFPFAAQSLGMLTEDGALDTPTVCYLTDPAPHRLWVHPQVSVHLTVTEATAVEGTARYGVPMAAAGPLTPDTFAVPLSAAERAALRAELGVAEGRLLALLSTGSMGLGDVTSSVEALRTVDGATPVVLCGRNERLRRRLAALPGVVALGWRTDVPALMRAADVLVHNAGGLSLTEALVAGLPAVSYEVISGHGRANAATLAACGLAPWPREAGALAEALAAQAARGRVHLEPLPEHRQAAHVVADLARAHRRARQAPSASGGGPARGLSSRLAALARRS